MAIVLTSKFNPFTYDELVRPAMEMTKAHQEVEQALGELKAESMKMQNLANKETDPIAHAQYQRYASDLALQAASLARSGLRTSSRRDLYDMASRYQAEIVPIDTASKKREALVNQQRALRLQNPTMLFEREAAGMSLDELIQNPNADYGHAISGDFLAKQVATAASVLAKEARDSEEGKGKLKKMMLPFQYEYIKQKGFSREAVMEAILRGPNANKILTGIVDGVIKSSGVLDWGDRNTIAKAYNYANQGLYSAIGETTSQIVTDSYSMQDALNKRAAARAAKQQQLNKTKGGRVNPIALRSKRELDKNNKLIEKYKDYFTFDKNKGHYVLNDKGKNAILLGGEAYYSQKEGHYVGSTVTADRKEQRIRDINFYNFMKELNGNKPIYVTSNPKDGFNRYSGVSGPGSAGLLFQKFVNANEEGAYDTYHSTEYAHHVNKTDGEQIMSQIRSYSKGDIEEVDFNGKNGFEGTGNKYSASDLKDYSVSSLRYSKYGVTAMLVANGKDPIRVRLPKDYSKYYQDNAVSLADQAQTHYNLLRHNAAPIYDDSNQVIGSYIYDNPQDAAKAEENAEDLLYQMHSWGANIFPTTTTEPEKYSTF